MEIRYVGTSIVRFGNKKNSHQIFYFFTLYSRFNQIINFSHFVYKLININLTIILKQIVLDTISKAIFYNIEMVELLWPKTETCRVQLTEIVPNFRRDLSNYFGIKQIMNFSHLCSLRLSPKNVF